MAIFPTEQLLLYYYFNSFRPFQGPPNSLKELLGSAPPQDDPHANKAALPRESWQHQVLDVSPGAAQEEELRDSPPGKASPNNQTELLAGKERSPFSTAIQTKDHSSLGILLSYTNWTHRHWVKTSPRSFSSQQQPRSVRIWGSWWVCGECPALSSRRTWMGLQGWSPGLSEERWQDRLSLAVTGMASVTVWHPGVQLQAIHGCCSGSLERQRDSGRDSEISTSRTGERVTACQIICPTKAFPKTKALMSNIVISITKAFDILMLKKSPFCSWPVSAVALTGLNSQKLAPITKSAPRTFQHLLLEDLKALDKCSATFGLTTPSEVEQSCPCRDRQTDWGTGLLRDLLPFRHEIQQCQGLRGVLTAAPKLCPQHHPSPHKPSTRALSLWTNPRILFTIFKMTI